MNYTSTKGRIPETDSLAYKVGMTALWLSCLGACVVLSYFR